MNKDRSGGWLFKADKSLVRVSKWYSYLGGVAVVLAMLISVVDIILIKIFNSALPSAHEWVTYLNIMMVFPPLAYVELERGHTAVNLFDHKMSDGLKKAIRIGSRILAFAVMAFLTWRGAVLMVQKYSIKEMSSADAFAKLAFPIWPFVALYVVSAGLFALSFLWTIVRELSGMSILDQQEDVREQKGENSDDK